MATGRLDRDQTSQILVRGVPNQVKDQLNDPSPREDLAVLAEIFRVRRGRNTHV